VQKSLKMMLGAVLVLLLLLVLSGCGGEKDSPAKDEKGAGVVEETVVSMGFISDFASTDEKGFVFDPIEWITLEDKERLEELGIEENELPNGYYIHNPEKEAILYRLAEETKFVFIDWSGEFAPSEDERWGYETEDVQEFIRYLATYSDGAAKVPFIIEAKGDTVLKITEQYVP
jgi:hypothetical protein